MKTNSITRRSFLGRSLGATTALVGGPFLEPVSSLFAQATRQGTPVRFPPDLRGNTLTAAPADIEVWPGHHTSLFGLNGSVPAPTIRVGRWHRFAANVNNQLAEPLVLHWHGILSPAHMDGNPRDAVGPGQGYTVDFPIRQQAGTYWYHAHTDRFTSKQVYLGLAGFFIVEDPAEHRLRLPDGDHDVPLLLQDKRTNGEMNLAYAPEEMDAMTGFLGDAVFVNNTPQAWLSVDRGLYRLRLLNGSNARVFRVGFPDERPYQLMANDAGLLPAPVEVGTVMLAPGQRAEILVDFSPLKVGDSLTLMSHPFEGGGHGGGMTPASMDGPMPMPAQGAEMELLTFYVDREARGRNKIPQRLAQFQPYNPADARTTRTFVITVDGMMHLINGALFDIDRTDFTVPFGELEIWQYVNQSDEFHPMHPHGALMQVLERHGMDMLPAEDTGWKDTVLVAPGETVRVLVRYDTHAGPYVHHCHNLEHEDNGMMQNLDVLFHR